jgi:hypothetical protein
METFSPGTLEEALELKSSHPEASLSPVERISWSSSISTAGVLRS